VNRKETASGKDRIAFAWRSQDGRLSVELREKAWETEFFARRFGRLALERQEPKDVEAPALDRALREALSSGDRDGFDLIEVELDTSWFPHIGLFEDHGFRLVDTKVRFLTFAQKPKMDGEQIAEGDVLFASEDMKEEILGLTRKAFVENPLFTSRFNNPAYFSRQDTERYYAARIENSMRDRNSLFAVMRDEGKIVGYLIYTRAGEHRGDPLYKATLIAVAPEHRGKRIYFALGSFIYRHFPEGDVYLDMTTQLTNLSALRNLIKERRTLEKVQMVFYRRKKPS
jgi:ribosomal protein S18 acetylase RimI-like enzyme